MSSRIIFETGYFQAPNDIFDSEIDLKANEKLVYLYLVRCGNNSKAFPSYNKIGEKCSISRSTAIRCVKTLTNKGLIKKEYRISNHDERNLTNIYRIVPPSVTKTPPSVTVTPNKELSDKQLSKDKRYTITSNGDYVFNYFSFKYKNHYNKEHPTITYEQLNRLKDTIKLFRNEYNVGDEEWKFAVDEHFKMLKRNKSNNGNILGFINGDDMQGSLVRYLEVK